MTGPSSPTLGSPRGVRWTFDVTTRPVNGGREKIVGVRKGYDVERGVTLWANDRELRQAWTESARTRHHHAQIIPWEEEAWSEGPEATRLWQELTDGPQDALGTAEEWNG